MKKRGQEVSISKASALSCFEALESLHNEFLCPFLQNNANGVTIKKVLGSDEVLLLFYENIKSLGSLFSKYSSLDIENKSDKNIDILTKNDEFVVPKDINLNLKQFTKFVNDAFVVNMTAEEAVTQGEVIITLKDVRQ